LEDPREINGDDLKNISYEADRHFKNKEGISERNNELAMNSMHKNIRDLYRGTNQFKTGYQPRSNLVKDDNGDLRADSRNILNR
jgi:hypothetical protein